MSSPVRQLIDARRAELMDRLEQLEHVRAAGEGAATRSLEVGLLENELAFLRQLVEALAGEALERSTAANVDRAFDSLEGRRRRGSV